MHNITEFFGLEQRCLEQRHSLWTAREIKQQPAVWRQAFNGIEASRQDINSWLQPLLVEKNLRIILSGAGTSAFIGEALAPWLRYKLRRRVDAVSTTDLVSDPSQCLSENVPTLMISFARSGDSPESVAGVQLANQVLDDCHHLVVTCNPEGHLAKQSYCNDNMKCLLMPAATNDRSFAMTSSFTSMLVACLAIFTPDVGQLELAASVAEQVLENQVDEVRSLAELPFSRLVVLGAGCLLGIAREASLKFLELSAGKVVPLFDTPLGFRHGPKSVIDRNTLILHLQSSDAYIHRYDNDLLDELQGDEKAGQIVSLSPQRFQNDVAGLEDVWLALPYIVYCQMLAFFKALHLGVSADNPCPSGEVNRVVQGVTIHPFGQD